MLLERGNAVHKAQDRLELKERKAYCTYRRFHNKYRLEGIRRAMSGKNPLLSSYKTQVNNCQGTLVSRENDRKEIKEIKECLRR